MDSQVSVTSLAEPLTDLTRAQLRSAIKKETSRGKFLHVVDLRALDDLDTRTLAEIIRVRRGVREVGGALTLVADQPNILKILTINGLDRVLGVHSDLPEAFEALGVSELIPA
jgi:anti-anti-sigma factor